MIIPDINNYNNYKLFFKDLYLLNNSKNSVWSYRKIASQVKWPASLLNEIINGKRSLSLDRALEFANVVGMDGFDTERLIFLVLAKAKTNKHKRYFEEKINQKIHTDLHKKLEIVDEKSGYLEVGEDIYSDITLLLILDFLNLDRSKKVRPLDIYRYLSISELKNKNVILEKIKFLESKKLLKIEMVNNKINQIIPLCHKLHFLINRENIHHMSQFMKITQNNLSRNTQGWVCSAFIKISRENIQEVLKRYEEFRGYILNLENNQTEEDKPLLFQLDLNLLNRIDIQEYHGMSFKDWLELPAL